MGGMAEAQQLAAVVMAKRAMLCIGCLCWRLLSPIHAARGPKRRLNGDALLAALGRGQVLVRSLRGRF